MEKGRAADKQRMQLAATALERFNRAQSDRWRQERLWYMNMAFYYGQHHLKWRNPKNATRGTYDLHLPDAPYWRVRPVINHIRKICRREMTRLTSQKPNAYIVPASTEDKDIFAAQAGEQIWDSMWRRLNFQAILREIVFWQTVCGNGFSKQWWDAGKFDKIDNVYGDVAINAVSPFHMYVPDLKTLRLEDQPFLIHAKVVSKQWIRNTLGIEPSDNKNHIVDEGLLNVMGINQLARDHNTILLEFWCKPGAFKELPQGGMFTIADATVVQGQENLSEIYEHGDYPYTKFDAIPTGKFYNESIIVDLIPIQQELNRSRGQVVEAKNLMAKPKMSAEEGSVNVARITSEPGQYVLYKMGYERPQPIPMQNLPAYVTEEINRLYADLADLSGQHEVSEGKTPPGVTAAVAISYLQEHDETLISGHFASLEEGIERIGKHCLSYVQTFWSEPRTIRSVGLDKSFDVQSFHGSVLNGNTDIRTEAGSALPTSRAAKQAFIVDLMKMGFIPPEEGLEILEVGGLNKIYERVQIDQRQVQRENLKMRVVTEEDVLAATEAWNQRPIEERSDPNTGAPLVPPLIVPVNSYDNHALHVELHNRYRKTQAYEMASSLVKRLFEEHVQAHKTAMMSPENLAAAPQLGQPLGPGVPYVSGPGPEGGQTPMVQPNGAGPTPPGSAQNPTEVSNDF